MDNLQKYRLIGRQQGEDLGHSFFVSTFHFPLTVAILLSNSPLLGWPPGIDGNQTFIVYPGQTCQKSVLAQQLLFVLSLIEIGGRERGGGGGGRGEGGGGGERGGGEGVGGGRGGVGGRGG